MARKILVIRAGIGGQGHVFNIGIPKARVDMVMPPDAGDTWKST